MPDAHHPIIAAFEAQVRWSRQMQAPFTAALLERATQALRDGEPVLTPLLDWPGEALADALPVRLAGALHALVLDGRAPELERYYPGGDREGDGADALWPEAVGALAAHPEHLDAYLSTPPQTNEVGRSAVLLGGFAAIARRFDLSMRLLELGASAGLNLAWDRYAYVLGDQRWGEPAAAPCLQPVWDGPAPDLDVPLRIAERRACDRQPVDLDDPAQRLRLRAYVWAEHGDRRQRLEQAIAVARAEQIRVEQADAADWLQARLAEPCPGQVRVVYHSIFWHYLPAPTRERMQNALYAAGREATEDAPLAWLRLEFPGMEQDAELRLSCWPGGEDICLARADGHARRVQWLGAGVPAATPAARSIFPPLPDP